VTPSNSTIQTALNDILIAASLGYDIAWPGLPFTPPTSGAWLEVTFLPNRGVDDRLANDGHVSPQGIYQIVCVSRPQSELKLRSVAEQVMAAFPKGTPISGNVRVGSHPYTGTLRSDADRMSIAVTIEYSE
jgi:hypothetical protein